MAPRTRSAGAPPTGHRQLEKEAPKTPSKRPRDESESESDRESKRPHTEPRGLPIFQRNQSYIARNRARWHQKAHTSRGPRFADVTQVPLLQPTTREQAVTPVRQSIEQEQAPAQSENKQSTLGWLMSIPGRLFSPAPPRTTETPSATHERSTSPTPTNRQVAELPSPQAAAGDIFTSDLSPKRPARPSSASLYKKRRIERGTHPPPTAEAEEPELMTEEVEGSKKRKLASNSFALTYSDDEDDNNDEETYPPATVAKAQTPSKSPLKSAFRSTLGNPTRKQLRINETPTRVKKLYGHYGPAGEYHGSTFADKTNNSFSTVESPLKSSMTDESSIAGDADTVRRLAVTPEANYNAVRNMFPNSEGGPDRNTNIFGSTAKSFVQPNSFQVPDDDDDDDDTSPIEDGNAIALTPDAPRMSHAELPEVHQPVESGESAEDPTTRKESEEAALKKLREQAQKYKPKTSSRLSTVEEKSRSRSSSPPASTSAEDIINAEAQQEEQQHSGEGPYTAPYAWTKPPRPSYSSKDPHYEPWVYDDIHIGSDGMTDKQRHTTRDAAADAWVVENVKWPEPLTYVDAGLCSQYIDDLVQSEIPEEGRWRAEKFYDDQFEDVLKWAYVEKEKGNTCALTWDNGRQEVVW